MRSPGSRSLSVLLLAVLSCQPDTAITGSLDLEEAWTIPIPAGVEPIRVVTDPHGGILVQAPVGLFINRSAPDSLRYVGPFDALDIIGLRLTPEGLEVVDRHTRRIAALGSSGRIDHWRSIGITQRPVAAAHTTCGWVIVSGADDTFEMVLISDDGEAEWTRSIELKSTFLSGHGRQIIAGSDSPPFETRIWDCRSGKPLAMLEEPPADLPSGAWRALPPVALPGGYLRTLADVQSDARMFQVFRSDGRFLRQRTMSAPLGLVATYCRDFVLGFRRVESAELVGYRANWSPPTCRAQIGREH